jgi:hypothetical protein
MKLIVFGKKTGHTEIVDSPEVIKEKFEEIMQAGGVAFDTTPGKEKRLTAFDPEAQEITVTTQFVGG